MATATFTPYDLTNSESELHAHAGETVEIGPMYDADPAEGIYMHVVTFPDGTKSEAFAEELSNHAY